MGMWVEGYSMYEKERWDEAEKYGKEKGREAAISQIAENLKKLGISEDVIKAATTFS